MGYRWCLSTIKRMPSSHAIRLIARWVLAWFALSLGVAMASPLVNPHPLEMVCSGMGVMKLIIHTDSGSTEQAAPALDCPLCANLAAPPPSFLPALAVPANLAFTKLPIEIVRVVSLCLGPWQARAPPAFL